MNEEILILNKQDLISQGGNRLVFKYPNDSTKVIKVESKIKLLRRKITNKHFWKRFRHYSRFGENKTEIKYYNNTLLKKKKKNIFKNIPMFYGTVNTNYGEGMVVEYIKGKNLYEYIKENGLTHNLKIAFKNLYTNLIDNCIEIRDFQPSNFIVKEMPLQNDIYIYIYIYIYY